MTNREYLEMLIASLPYREWAKRHPIDASKVAAAMKGQTTPAPSSKYGKALVGLAQLNPKNPTSTYNGVLKQPGALWRQSDSEDIERFYNAGGRWALLQFNADDWSVIMSRCDTYKIPYGLWFHCRRLDQLEVLLQIAHVGHFPICGLNIEQELETTLTPPVVADAIKRSGYQGECIIIAMGWVQNNVRVTDDDLGKLGWLLEMFPSDAADLWPPKETWSQCVQHAKSQGIRYPFLLAQAYHNAQPEWYPYVDGIYAADDVSDQFELWF